MISDSKISDGLLDYSSWVRMETLSPQEIGDAVYVVKDHRDWQHLRTSMKGLTTKQKMWALHEYLYDIACVVTDRNRWVRVVNYINALKRGGQLK